MTVSALEGRSIVNTRAGEPDDELTGLLTAAGARVRARPLVGIVPPADPTALPAALADLASFDWVVFTSANAVRACAAAVPAGAAWPRCACVGTGTARAARAAGIPVALVPEQFTAEGLAAAWPAATLPGARVLWPRASGARPTLARLLRAAGAEVTAPVAYDTRADGEAARRLHEELRVSPPDALLFTSPSAVRAFTSAGAAPDRLIIGVIGSVTAAAAREAGLIVQVQPSRNTLADLGAALAAHFATAAPPAGQPAGPAPGKA